MLSSIVVPLDGGPGAERALPVARELAAGFGVPLLLFGTTAQREEPAARAYLDAVAERVAHGLGPAGAQTLLHRGFAASALADEVRRRPGAVVCAAVGPGQAGAVAGTAGRPGLEPAVEDVIERGNGPVVLVGPRYRAGTPVLGPDRAVLLCVDGSPLAASIEDVAVEWATALGLPVELVTVVTRGAPFLGDVPVDRVLHDVARLAFRLERRGVEVTTAALDDGRDPARAVTRHAEGRPVALIAASTHGYRHDLCPVVGRGLLEVVALASVPVLVARPALGRRAVAARQAHQAGV